jgi:hypothetical protein
MLYVCTFEIQGPHAPIQLTSPVGHVVEEGTMGGTTGGTMGGTTGGTTGSGFVLNGISNLP